jgi:prolyl-tRNA editing enzyme YbaK/EbsC (Cys-tRNA(Pro) deacylase)/polyhydroxyalkanoate synthesis regulator phasin
MKANDFLSKKGIDFELIVQENPTKDCDAAAEERGIETRQIVKSLIVERSGELVHVCIPGDRTLSEKLFGEHRMADPERSLDLTGQESGTVHPFSSELKHFVDERIFENHRVSFTIGHVKKAVIMRSENFREALETADFEVEVTDLVVTTDEDIDELEAEGLDQDKAVFVAENGYRKLFLELNQDFEMEKAVKLLMEFGRNDETPEVDVAEEILDRADNETHLQKLVETFFEEGELPEQNDFDLDDVVDEVLTSNPEAVEDLENGKESAINYLMGQIMQETNGRVDGGEARQKIMQRT